MIKFDTLYKIDNKGKVREWDISVNHFPNENRAEILVIHGEKDGKKQLKVTNITSGKNIGKKNETSVLDQAILEAESKHLKQQDKGYLTSVSDRIFRPMLAHEYKDYKKKLLFPCYIQPKLDGLRCVIEWDSEKHYPVAYSRKGKVWKTVDHILDNVYSFLDKNRDIILDGELFTKEISFQDICGAIKRDTPSDSTKLVKFHCYDLFLKNNPQATFRERKSLIPKDLDELIMVDTRLCVDEYDIDIFHKNFIEKGYEGSILRNKKGIYKVDGRSHDLLKNKDFQDAEYKIIGKELDKNSETVFVCLDEKTKKQFKCKPEGTHEKRVTYYKEDNIGKYLTVRFFELTDDGLPRFPVGIGVRDYE